jgi:hypothetical protein
MATRRPCDRSRRNLRRVTTFPQSVHRTHSRGRLAGAAAVVTVMWPTRPCPGKKPTPIGSNRGCYWWSVCGSLPSARQRLSAIRAVVGVFPPLRVPLLTPCWDLPSTNREQQSLLLLMSSNKGKSKGEKRQRSDEVLCGPLASTHPIVSSLACHPLPTRAGGGVGSD